MDRRSFLVTTAGSLLTLAAGDLGKADARQKEPEMKARVSIVKGMSRPAAIDRAVGMLGVNPVAGRNVLIKPNFNTADPFPASTHNDTLVGLIRILQNMGAKSLAIGERCGPPDTADVMRDKGIDAICRE